MGRGPARGANEGVWTAPVALVRKGTSLEIMGFHGATPARDSRTRHIHDAEGRIAVWNP